MTDKQPKYDFNLDEQRMYYHSNRLKPGTIYLDSQTRKLVEFGYLGQTGYAIVYEPGDSGGGMQSAWGINPENLESIVLKLL